MKNQIANALISLLTSGITFAALLWLCYFFITKKK